MRDEGKQQEKKQLRRALLAKAEALPAAYRRAADAAICQRLLAMAEYQAAQTVFLFVGVKWEIDTLPLLDRAWADGKQVAVPRCRRGGEMDACMIRSRGDLAPVPPLGLWEPSCEALRLDPATLNFVLVPCLACDLQGYRLGQGAGYYDRFLARQPFFTLAICREKQLSTVPIEPHDVPVKAVLTEERLIRLPTV